MIWIPYFQLTPDFCGAVKAAALATREAMMESFILSDVVDLWSETNCEAIFRGTCTKSTGTTRIHDPNILPFHFLPNK